MTEPKGKMVSKAPLEIINTHEQLFRAGGGVAICIFRGGARTDYVSGYTVYRVGADGREVKTDPGAPWYQYGRKWFAPGDGKFHERQRAAFEAAKKWVAGQGWYSGEWARNRSKAYVPVEINKRFPIRKKP